MVNTALCVQNITPYPINGTKLCGVSSTNKTEYYFAGSYYDISAGREIGRNASPQMENGACFFTRNCDPEMRVQDRTGVQSHAASKFRRILCFPEV